MTDDTTAKPFGLHVVQGDCLELLRQVPDASIDAIVTDPPYGLSKEPDMVEVLRHWLAGDDYTHKGGGFLGKTWDSFVPGPAVWRECLRVLKPGGHLVAFFAPRTYHLGAVAVALAGFQIRDMIEWLFGSGFPKSLDVSKAIDKMHGAEREVVGERVYAGGHIQRSNGTDLGIVNDDGWHGGNGQRQDTAPATPDAQRWAGWGTALKPAQEPIVLARKPLVGTVAKNVLAHGTGALNVDGCRIGNERSKDDFCERGFASAEPAGRSWTGRWPANVILDEVAGALLDEQTGELKAGTAVRKNNKSGGATSYAKAHAPGTPDLGYADSGGASRFFYCPKTPKREREAGLDDLPTKTAGELTGGRKEGSAGLNNPRAGAGRTSNGRRNSHPTVKPIALMRWLVRLVTPPGGIVLDPFTGSGSTGCAAALEGVSFLGLELEPEYVEIATRRIEHWRNEAADE